MFFTDQRNARCWLPILLLAALGCETNIKVIPAPSSSTDAAKTVSDDAKTTTDVKATTGETVGPPPGVLPTVGGLKRLIVLTNGDAPFWDACREGVDAAEIELNLKSLGLDAVVDVNDGSPQGQLAKLQQYGTQSDIAGIGVSAIDADNVAIADELRSLQKKGIKILTIDSDIDRANFSDARYAFIGTDNLSGGKVLGQCARGLKPAGGEYVTFVGRTGAQNAIERIGGFQDGAGDNFVKKDSMADDYDKTRARDNVRNAIRNHPNLSVLVGIWSYNAPAIVDIVKEAKRRKDFLIVTFDAEPTAISAMAEGSIDAMVVQNPFQMGFQGIRCLAALHNKKTDELAEMFPKYGQPGGDIYDTGLKVVVPDDKSALKAELFDKSVEFVTLEQLQQWMKKYGLTGS